jgi:hypothetical protein
VGVSTHPACLKKHIFHFTILIDGSPKVVLLAIDLDEDFVDLESVSIAVMLSLQSPRVQYTELDTPQTDRFSTDSDTSRCQQILDISVAELKPVVHPDCIGNDIWREAVSFICAHVPILTILAP